MIKDKKEKTPVVFRRIKVLQLSLSNVNKCICNVAFNPAGGASKLKIRGL